MALVPTTIRMDSELKKRFDSLCEEFGMSVNTAINIFVKAVVRSRSIPFKIEVEDTSDSSKGMRAFNALRANQGAEMSLDEINAEINDYRRGQQ